MMTQVKISDQEGNVFVDVADRLGMNLRPLPEGDVRYLVTSVMSQKNSLISRLQQFTVGVGALKFTIASSKTNLRASQAAKPKPG